MHARLLALALLLGCDTGVKVATSSPDDVYSVTDVATLAELERMLSIKGCEGWRYVDSYPHGEQFVLILSRRGPASAPDPKCRR